MLYSQAETQDLLRRITNKFASDPALVEDLCQEAMIHLWKLEVACPLQTQSWYLQSCQHFVQDQLRAGRSVDSPKHSHQRVALDAEDSAVSVTMEEGGVQEISCMEDEVVSTACFHDLLQKLQSSTTSIEFQVLQMLADGFSMSDIARIFGVSHTAIHKQRRHLIALANRLGVSVRGAPMPPKLKLSLAFQPTAAGASAAPNDAGVAMRILAKDGGTLARGIEAAFHAASRAALGIDLVRRRK